MDIRVSAPSRRTCGRGSSFWVVLLLAAAFSAPAGAQGLSADAQQRVRAATFEVVQLKPDEGAVIYERALPMELLPYQQRVDKYRSIGTAFAIGPNRFVTAGHVISLGTNSQFGPPALRDAAGMVYPIDQVIKYSDSQDFVEFSLQHAPAKLKPLKTAEPPPLNDPVYAVGNALGQGVVIRDGTFTSTTPEEIEGRWNWLRFSAAASPGNSGGPLVDKNGDVIGVVLRKSQSENLNYAVPIKLMSTASESEASIEGRINFRLPIMDASEIINTNDHFPLPKSLADFFKAMMAESAATIARGDQQITEHNKDRLFPHSAGSAQLLKEVIPSAFPRRIQESQERRWVTAGPKDIQISQLDHNGYVRHGGAMFELRAPDDIKLATLFSDSKVFMDLLLRGAYDVRRQVGSDSVKVTSLGKAREEFVKTDAYGRNWSIKVWAIPFDDAYLITMNLPTPEGMVSLFAAGPSPIKDLMVHQQEMLLDYVWVTYEGTLPRWREFLDIKSAQPQSFSKLSLAIDPAYKRVRFQSPRYEVDFTPEVIGLTEDSVLSLNFSFIKDGETVAWDVGGIALGEGARHINFVDVRRFERPAMDMPQPMQVNWTKIMSADFPYNGVASDAQGGKTIRAAAAGPDGTANDSMNVRYVLTVHNEGSPTQDALHAKLEGLEKGFKPLEH